MGFFRDPEFQIPIPGIPLKNLRKFFGYLRFSDHRDFLGFFLNPRDSEFLRLRILVPGIRDFLSLGIFIPGIRDFSKSRDFNPRDSRFWQITVIRDFLDSGF